MARKLASPRRNADLAGSFLEMAYAGWLYYTWPMRKIPAMHSNCRHQTECRTLRSDKTALIRRSASAGGSQTIHFSCKLFPEKLFQHEGAFSDFTDIHTRIDSQ